MASLGSSTFTRVRSARARAAAPRLPVVARLERRLSARTRTRANAAPSAEKQEVQISGVDAEIHAKSEFPRPGA